MVVMGPLETLITKRMFEVLLVTNKHPDCVWMTLPDMRRILDEWRVLQCKKMPESQVGESKFKFGAVPITVVTPGEDTPVGVLRVGYTNDDPLYITLPPETE